MKNALFILSIILIVGSFYLILMFQNSGRISLIAGITSMAGFMLNIFSYLTKKSSSQEEIIVRNN